MSEWRPIAEAPLEERVLLWWTPIDGNPYAEAPIFGTVSAYKPGKYWADEGEYRDLERITHWAESPQPPKDNDQRKEK